MMYSIKILTALAAVPSAMALKINATGSAAKNLSLATSKAADEADFQKGMQAQSMKPSMVDYMAMTVDLSSAKSFVNPLCSVTLTHTACPNRRTGITVSESRRNFRHSGMAWVDDTYYLKYATRNSFFFDSDQPNKFSKDAESEKKGFVETEISVEFDDLKKFNGTLSWGSSAYWGFPGHFRRNFSSCHAFFSTVLLPATPAQVSKWASKLNWEEKKKLFDFFLEKFNKAVAEKEAQQ